MPLGLETLTRAVFKRARRGLYAGRKILTGNNVSEDGGNRTRRVWRPNVHNKSLFSHLLNRMVRLRVTAAALRNIDKAGGLDNYILETPSHKLDSDVGEALKRQMQQVLEQRQRQRQQQQQRAQQRQQRAQQLLPPAAAAAAAASGAA